MVDWGRGYEDALANSLRALASKRPLFEATFSDGFALARADILDPSV